MMANKVLLERNAEILEMRQKGISYGKIAKVFKLSPQMISYICKEQSRKQEKEERYGDLYPLPQRTLNAILRAGIHTRKQLKEAFLKGVDIAMVGNKGQKAIERLVMDDSDASD